MTNYSKSLAKYSKNIKSHTKCRRSKRKNSMRNKKILYGGNPPTLDFFYSDIKYILTKKKKGFLDVIGAGTYEIKPHTLALSIGEQITIDKLNLKDFTSALLEKQQPFVEALYKKLFIESSKPTFKFKSLYTVLTVLTRFSDLYKTYNTISIEAFRTMIAGSNIDMKYLSSISSFDSTKTLCERYVTLKEIYDSIPRGLVIAMDAGKVTRALAQSEEAGKVTGDLAQSEIEILNTIYKDFPLSKINPRLPSLITLFPKQFPREVVGATSSVYSVTFDRKKCELKVKHYDTLDEAAEFMQTEVIQYNSDGSRTCPSNDKTQCKFISAYCNFTEKLIYVLMEPPQ
jgi:hypothetical protein